MIFAKTRKLRTNILIAFSTVLFASVICEIFYYTKANKEIVLNFEKEYYLQKISSMATNWLNSYFRQIELVVNVLSKNQLFSNFSDFTALFKTALKKTPFILTFQVALTDGSLLQVRNISGLTSFQKDQTTPLPSYVKYAIRKMEHSNTSGEMKETWEYLNEDFSIATKENLQSAKYDPRSREWYKETIANKKLVWSDAYLLITSKVFGITVSSPIMHGKQNDIKGVISVDFSINDFCELLNLIKMTPNSVIRLINDKNEILASSNKKEIEVSKSRKELQKIFDINDEPLHVAIQKLVYDDKRYIAYETNDGKEYVASKQRLDNVPFSMLIVTPQSDFTEDFNRIRFNMFLLSIMIFLISSGIIFLFSSRLSNPIRQLCKTAISIKKMDFSNNIEFPKSNIFEINSLSSAMQVMKKSLSTLSKYTSKEFINESIKEGTDVNIGGITKDITIFFSDIEKFSTISEKLSAEYLISHLSEYFNELTKAIMKHNGIISSYIGDAIMAIWGAQNKDDNQAINACETALEIQEKIEQLKIKWALLGKPALPTRIGIHSGSAIVGNIGSKDRMDFTAIGNAIDIASFLEGANKIYGTWILASETVETQARNKFLFRIVDKVIINKFGTIIKIFEPMCSFKSADEYYKMLELCSKSNEAFELYQNQNFKDAIKLYKEVLKTFPDKAKSINVLISRCETFSETPPMNWNGSYEVTI